MTSHTGRLYALAFALVAFFLAWAVVAAHPWATALPDPRLQALAAREAQLRHEARLVNQVVAQRWAALPERAAVRARRRSRPRRRRRRNSSPPSRPAPRPGRCAS